MTVTIEETFIAMEPFFDKLLKQKFVSSEDAIDYCHRLCLEYGFTVKHETGANRSIYIYCCSRESSKKRPYECQWKVVLSQDEMNTWKFRKSSNPNTTEHNHELIKETGGEEEWPQEVIQKIIQLSRQKGQEIDEIREIIKLQFPHITWNDRRFLNYFMEERKRQKQKEITQRVQKLIMSTTKLCSVVAANEDWASCVESDLIKMLNTYRQRTRVSNQSLDNMVDLQMDMIHSEIDTKSSGNNNGRKPGVVYNHSSNKKRKSSSLNTTTQLNHVDGGVQIMSIPSCTLFIRSQPLRSLSEPSSSTNNNSRRALNDMITSTNQQQQLNASFGVNSVFNLTSPISSPSSTSSIQQRMDYGNSFRSNDMLQSPPIPDSNMMMSTTNYGPSGNSMYSFSPYQQQQQQQQQQQSSSASTSGYSGSGGNSNDFSFEPTSTYGQLTTPSPAPILIHGNNNRSGSNMYYTSTSHIGREPTSSNNNNSSGIQQRIMLQQQQQQQEYEQQQRHFMDHNIHLPTIRGGVNPHDALVQQQHHHPHHHHHINPNQPQQNWS